MARSSRRTVRKAVKAVRSQAGSITLTEKDVRELRRTIDGWAQSVRTIMALAETALATMPGKREQLAWLPLAGAVALAFLNWTGTSIETPAGLWIASWQ